MFKTDYFYKKKGKKGYDKKYWRIVWCNARKNSA